MRILLFLGTLSFSAVSLAQFPYPPLYETVLGFSGGFLDPTCANAVDNQNPYGSTLDFPITLALDCTGTAVNRGGEFQVVVGGGAQSADVQTAAQAHVTIPDGGLPSSSSFSGNGVRDAAYYIAIELPTNLVPNGIYSLPLTVSTTGSITAGASSSNAIDGQSAAGQVSFSIYDCYPQQASCFPGSGVVGNADTFYGVSPPTMRSDGSMRPANELGCDIFGSPLSAQWDACLIGASANYTYHETLAASLVAYDQLPLMILRVQLHAAAASYAPAGGSDPGYYLASSDAQAVQGPVTVEVDVPALNQNLPPGVPPYPPGAFPTTYQSAPPGGPTAVASVRTPVVQGELVELDGSSSIDAVDYLWQQGSPGANPVNILGATGAIATFVAPNVSAPQPLEFWLTVRDSLGVPDSVRISTLVVPELTRFLDVPSNHWAYSFIEALAASGITSGCGNGGYCPTQSVTRAQMAVFLERGMRGAAYVPPAASGSRFGDVGANSFAAGYIEQLYLDGITAGCGGGNYCPSADVSRAQMAVFLLRAMHGAAYTPPPATGLFADVGSGYWAAAWIEQLAAEGITAGCGSGNYCPEAVVTRAQMAVFLVRAFGL